MPMRATTVRFGDDLWSMLERESSRHGVSSAQFVRDATILRIAYLAAERGDAQTRTTVAQLAAEASAGPGPRTAAVVTDEDRVRAVRDTGLLDGRPHEGLDRLADLAARVVRAPVGLVCLVDRDRQVFAGCAGLAEPWATRRETPLSHSICQYTIDSDEQFVVEDLRSDPVLRESLAVDDLAAVAYAGVPLVTEEGHALGALCAIDHRPRSWTEEELRLLRDIAGSALTEIRLHAVGPA